MTRTRSMLWIVGLVALSTAGCTQESSQGAATVFNYQWWVSPVAILVGVGVAVWGWMQRATGWRAYMTLAVGVLATVTFCPFGWFDKVSIDNEHFEARWGFWCFPSTHKIAFNDVNGVTLTAKKSTSRRGRRTSYSLVFQLKSGAPVEVATGNSLMDAASEKLVATLQAKGITILDTTNGQ